MIRWITRDHWAYIGHGWFDIDEDVEDFGWVKSFDGSVAGATKEAEVLLGSFLQYHRA